MKAMLVMRGKRFPMIHDLPTINSLLQQAGIEMPISDNNLALLSSYVIRARYAEDRPEMEDAKEALSIARAVRKFARAYLKLE